MIHIKHLFCLVFMTLGFISNAQVTVFSEDFNGNLGTFTASAGTPVGAVWEHSSTSTAATGIGGTVNALFWGTRTAIQSPSTLNGCAMYNSDVYDGGGIGVGSGLYPGTHSGELTSGSINLTNYSNVVLKFNQYARANANAVSTLLDVSTDNGVTWVNFPINPLVIANAGTTDDDQQLIDISSVAGGQSNVKVRFTWNGRYYYWLIDDVEIIEKPNNNLAISDYYYPPASYETPVTQASADTFRFSTRVTNTGAATQNNVKVYAEILNSSLATLWIDSMTISSIPPNIDTVFNLSSFYIPSSLQVGDYGVRYSVASDSVDFDLSDNSLALPFEISDTVFHMSNGVTSASRPGGGGDYAIANLYKTASNFVTGTYRATTVDFTVAKNAVDGPLDGNSVTVYLLEVSSSVNDSWSNFNTSLGFSNHPDLTILGVNSYTFPVGSANYDDFQVELYDFLQGGYGVPLKPNTRYLTAVEFQGTNNLIFCGMDNTIDRDKTSTILFNGSWFLNGFGPVSSGVVSMNLEYFASVSPTIEFVNSNITIDEDAMSLNVPIEIINPSTSNATTVDVTLDISSTATNGSDFTFSSPTSVTFPAGTFGNQMITIPIILDNVMDDGETIVLKLSSSSNLNFGADSVVTITINDVQITPIVAINDSYSVVFNTPITFQADANDISLYPIQSLNILQQPANGSLVILSPTNYTMSYTPDSAFCGMDSATYVICDAFNCDTASIYFDVACQVYPLKTINQVNTVNSSTGVAVSENEICELRGVVHGIDFFGGNGYSFTLIDATGGINVFEFDDVDGYVVNEGDEISVKGTIIQFNGLIEIKPDSIHLTGTGVLSTPMIVTTLDESTESQLVKIEAVVLIDPTQWTNAGSGFNVQVRNTTDTLTIRIDADTDIFGQPAPTSWFNVTGIGSQFDNTAPYFDNYQVFPRYQTDIEVISNTTQPTSLENQIKFYPNPAKDWLWLDSQVELMSIRILNTLGQEVKNIQAPKNQSVISLKGLPSGVYTISFLTENSIWTEQFIKH